VCALQFQVFHEYLQNTFPLVHSRLEKKVINNYSLLYTWKGNSGKSIMMCGHLDVVPVDSDTEGKWNVNPWNGTIQDGYIWGRGTLDDKVGTNTIQNPGHGCTAPCLLWVDTQNTRCSNT
jgi:carboxypeptidase PM20D1